MFVMFFYYSYVFFCVLETCKIKPVCLIHIALLPSFIHDAVLVQSLTLQLLFCMGDIVG